MTEAEQEDRDMAIAKEAVARLGEHFDTVQLFVTRFDQENDSSTMNLQYGTGNWFARYGQIETWVERVREDTRIERRAKDNQ